MGQTNLKWNDKEVLRNVTTHLERRMTKAANYVELRVKENISRGNKSGLYPSLPDEFPKVVTGTLRASIGHEVRKDSQGVHGYVGVRRGVATADAEPYALKLELGTSKMKPRPYLRPTVLKERKKIFKLITGK